MPCLGLTVPVLPVSCLGSLGRSSSSGCCRPLAGFVILRKQQQQTAAVAAVVLSYVAVLCKAVGAMILSSTKVTVFQQPEPIVSHLSGFLHTSDSLQSQAFSLLPPFLIVFATSVPHCFYPGQCLCYHCCYCPAVTGVPHL